jgi:hypothetical protein
MKCLTLTTTRPNSHNSATPQDRRYQKEVNNEIAETYMGIFRLSPQHLRRRIDIKVHKATVSQSLDSHARDIPPPSFSTLSTQLPPSTRTQLYPRDQFPFALLYFTGPKLFNMAMRSHAESHYHLSLSDKKLGKAIRSSKGQKVGDVEGTSLRCASEEEIFTRLGACLCRVDVLGRGVWW